MNITLDPELEQRLRYKIACGEYSSVEAALNEALRRLLEPEAELADPLPLKEMRREIMIGVEQSDRGDVVPFDAEFIKAEGRRLLLSQQSEMSVAEGQTMTDFLKDFIGCVDSSAVYPEGSRLSENTGNTFAELMVEKHQQGKL